MVLLPCPLSPTRAHEVPAGTVRENSLRMRRSGRCGGTVQYRARQAVRWEAVSAVADSSRQWHQAAVAAVANLGVGKRHSPQLHIALNRDLSAHWRRRLWAPRCRAWPATALGGGQSGGHRVDASRGRGRAVG